MSMVVLTKIVCVCKLSEPRQRLLYYAYFIGEPLLLSGPGKV